MKKRHHSDKNVVSFIFKNTCFDDIGSKIIYQMPMVADLLPIRSWPVDQSSVFFRQITL